MKFNYEQMKEHFGIVYSYADFHPTPSITEQFNVFLFLQNQQAKTYEEAKDRLLDIFNNTLTKKHEILDKLIQAFDKLSFFEKNVWRLKNKMMDFRTIVEETKNKYQEDFVKSQESIVFEQIDKNKIFTILGPKLLKNDDELFVVVENHNQLDLGIYRAKVSKSHYFCRDESTIDIDGELTIVDNGTTYEFSFRAEPDSFVSGHTYHNIFVDKEEAIEYYKDTVQKRIDSMNQRLENLDKFDMPTVVSKPKM